MACCKCDVQLIFSYWFVNSVLLIAIVLLMITDDLCYTCVVFYYVRLFFLIVCKLLWDSVDTFAWLECVLEQQ